MDSPHEIIAAGRKLYDERLKTHLEPLYHGKLLALDIETGEYAVGDDTLSAFDGLRRKDPDGTICLLRVGYPAAITLGQLVSP